MSIEVKLPELGDGIDSGDVLEVLVSEGDDVKKDQGILELETDKATVEVPSTHDGRVAKVHISSGDTVEVGQVLVTLEEASAKVEDKPSDDGGDEQDEQQEKAEDAEAKDQPSEAAPSDSEAADEQAGRDTTERDVKQQEEAESEKVEEQPRTEQGGAEEDEEPGGEDRQAREAKRPAAKRASVTSQPQDEVIPAGPAVRRFAREVGVDLHQVEGSGEGGRITREDVLEVVRTASQAAKGKVAGGQPQQTDAWGAIRVEKLSKIRQTIARKMHESWSTVPRVTNFDDADVTELERIRQSSKQDYKKKGIKLTSLPFVIKALAMALRDHPMINASIDTEAGQVTYKEYVNIGIAVDTPRGLVVPVLRDVDDLAISEIARGLANIAETVREGSYSIEDLRGATFTVSNLGAIGGTYSTPIVNTPEVAILLVGRSRKLPVVIDDEVQVRLMMPLSLSYDHRLVDGAAAARFLNDVIDFLEAPSRLLLAP